MSLVLRPYQEEIIKETRSLMMKGFRRILICSPTGSGKTALTASMLKAASEKNKRSFFNVHRRELVNQSISAFIKADVDAGVISSGFKSDPTLPIQVASVPSLMRRHHKYSIPDLIIWDECPHIAAKSWESLFNLYPDSFHIGLTATPERLDGKGLDKFFDTIVKGPSVSWLISNKYLSEYKLFAPSSVDVSSIRTKMGDFDKTQLDEIMDKPTITGSAISEYHKHAKHKRGVVFCVSIKHSQHVVDQFNASHITAKHLDGTTPLAERDQAIRDFVDGKIKILSNVDLFSEGFDVPAMECVILLRPTQSIALYLQQVGRVLRYTEGKVAIILDHVGNVNRHGLPDDERNWSLLGKKGRIGTNKAQESGVKICTNCFAAQPLGADQCKWCERAFEKKPREILEVDGELSEYQRQIIKKNKRIEQARAVTLEDLIKIGQQRNYKHPYFWAKKIFNMRQAKKIRGG